MGTSVINSPLSPLFLRVPLHTPLMLAHVILSVDTLSGIWILENVWQRVCARSRVCSHFRLDIKGDEMEYGHESEMVYLKKCNLSNVQQFFYECTYTLILRDEKLFVCFHFAGIWGEMRWHGIWSRIRLGLSPKMHTY